MSQAFENIKKHLLDQGFQFEDDTFTTTQQRRQTMIINGTPHENVQSIVVKLQYLGQGCMYNQDGTETDLCGLCLLINDQDQVEFWAKDIDDLKVLMNLKF